MNPLNPLGPAGSPRTPSPVQMHGLSALYRAHNMAAGMHVDPWEFAVRLEALISAGLHETDVRYLAACGFAEHGEEVILPKAPRRKFRRMANLALTERTCLILTPAGAGLLQSAGGGQRAGLLLPRWDGETRKLWYGDRLVKWYRVPAICQEILLAAFEEDCWAPRIDDPLPRVNDIDPRERLHEAIRRLNGAQPVRLLTFRRDGTGFGVTWAANSQFAGRC